MPGSETVDSIVGAIRSRSYRYASEVELQDRVEDALRARALPVEREVQLDATRSSIIDMRVGTVGVEVKVGGSTANVERQLRRYAQTGEVVALVLVTNRTRHRTIAPVVAGIPVHVVSLVGVG